MSLIIIVIGIFDWKIRSVVSTSAFDRNKYKNIDIYHNGSPHDMMGADLGPGESHVVEGQVSDGHSFDAEWIRLENSCHVLCHQGFPKDPQDGQKGIIFMDFDLFRAYCCLHCPLFSNFIIVFEEL